MTDIDGTVLDEPEVSVELVRPPQPSLGVTPQIGADELVARLNVIRDAMNTAMQEKVDYGLIPGVEKPSLFKPGAEKLGVLFQLDVQLENEQTWGPGDHLTVTSRATVFHAPTGTRLGCGEGLCTTREKRYAKRKQERTCPSCGATAVIKGKEQYGGGWVCWKKKDGCGANFPDGDPAIEGQPVGEIDNPDLADCWNTVTKMAEKRARVDAILAVTGASALFTQDVEDTGAILGVTMPDAEAPSAPSRRPGVVETGKSDVTPPEDPWVLFTVEQLEQYGLTKELRNKLTELGHPPAKNARLKSVLRDLAPEVRSEVEAWIASTAAADVPFE